MEWTDHGIVVGVKRQGETAVLLDVLTREHGRHAGFVHGGRSRRLRACLQPGNAVELVWRSRIEEQLGSFKVEPRQQRAARIMDSASALHACNHLCALVRLLAEREPHPALHDRFEALLERIDDPSATPAALVRFELSILAELGYGLDLERCAATGQRHDLVYVSPKSGRAVSRAAGTPYHDRMLVMPTFLREDARPTDDTDLLAGLRLAGFFLDRDVFQPRGLPMPDARAAYLRTLAGPAAQNA